MNTNLLVAGFLCGYPLLCGALPGVLVTLIVIRRGLPTISLRWDTSQAAERQAAEPAKQQRRQVQRPTFDE